MDNILEYLNSKVKNNDTLIVATSSGPDSMCLLSLAIKIKKNIKIVCAHVNHNVRKESKEEYKYLEDFCKKNNIIFEGTVLKETYTSDFENKARKFRYDFFKKLKNKYHAKYILTAHHGDDLIETILMRISRGSTLSGYIGIKKEDGCYLRPLIELTKDEIVDYLNSNNIKYYIDNTNSKNIHTRNRYRKNILPFLKKEDPKIHLKYIAFSNKLNEYDMFVNNYIKKNKLIINNKISISKILKEDEIILKKTVELLIKEIQKNDFLEVSDEVMNNIIKIMHSKKSNNYINLSNDYLAKKDYDTFTIEKNNIKEDFYNIFNDYYEDDLFRIMKVTESDLKSNYVIRLNSKEIKLPLIIRNKKEKDIMFVKNLGNKKIKDIFINEKVKLSDRDIYPIVLDSNNNILWLPGLKKSKFDKEKTEKYDIILLCERK